MQWKSGETLKGDLRLRPKEQFARRGRQSQLLQRPAVFQPRRDAARRREAGQWIVDDVGGHQPRLQRTGHGLRENHAHVRPQIFALGDDGQLRARPWDGRRQIKRRAQARQVQLALEPIIGSDRDGATAGSDPARGFGNGGQVVSADAQRQPLSGLDTAHPGGRNGPFDLPSGESLEGVRRGNAEIPQLHQLLQIRLPDLEPLGG